ncbi:hypothetical protein [Aeromicrobium sp. Leaf350]|uniref:hypothetical protein n=1 Tax=Aeromicrobium sp. Leaf350 TaxID=2876565 RepID=UPI001E48261E|nr:hypothetical protein [Aeromicrobium sp. Leaf350]
MATVTADGRLDLPRTPISGELIVRDGCLVVADPTTATGHRLLVLPTGAEVRQSDPPAIVYAGLLIPVGTELGPASGLLVTRDGLSDVIEPSNSIDDALRDCSHAGDELAVVVSLRDVYLDLGGE